jgi:hypothetical protein
MANPARFKNGFILHPVFVCFLGVLILAGCGKPPAAPQSHAEVTTNSAPPPPPPPAAVVVVTGPGPNEKVCFECKGQGTVPCPAPGCKAGLVECPGPCLKLTRGTWTHMAVAGHGSNELWITFQKADGSTMSWNQSHVGEVIQMQNGNPVDIGKCKICGGTGKVRCDVCKGTGKETCPICDGKKYIPAAWTPTDNSWLNRQPDLIRLKSGQVVLGRVVSLIGQDGTILTRDKKLLHVKASDLPPGAGANPPATKTVPAK